MPFNRPHKAPDCEKRVFPLICLSEKEVKNKEIDKLIQEYTSFMKEKMNQSNNGFVTESGEVEKWTGGLDKEKMDQALKEGIEYLESLKK